MRQYAMVALLTLAAMLSSADRTSLSLVVTPLKQDLGISDLKMSLLLGVSFSLLYGFFTLPAGYLVDLHSRKRVIAGSVFAWSASPTQAESAGPAMRVAFAEAGLDCDVFVSPVNGPAAAIVP